MIKSKFLTIFFSILPGAGHMYMGYMKRGLSLLALFFLMLAGSSLVPFLGFTLPVIWVFSFFDALQLYNKYQVDGAAEDDWLFEVSALNAMFKGKTSTICGVALVGIGVLGFYHYFLEYPIYALVKEIPFLAAIVRNLPSLILCILMLVFGVILLNRRNKEEGQ